MKTPSINLLSLVLLLVLTLVAQPGSSNSGVLAHGHSGAGIGGVSGDMIRRHHGKAKRMIHVRASANGTTPAAPSTPVATKEKDQTPAPKPSTGSKDVWDGNKNGNDPGNKNGADGNGNKGDTSVWNASSSSASGTNTKAAPKQTETPNPKTDTKPETDTKPKTQNQGDDNDGNNDGKKDGAASESTPTSADNNNHNQTVHHDHETPKSAPQSGVHMPHEAPKPVENAPQGIKHNDTHNATLPEHLQQHNATVMSPHPAKDHLNGTVFTHNGTVSVYNGTVTHANGSDTSSWNQTLHAWSNGKVNTTTSAWNKNGKFNASAIAPGQTFQDAVYAGNGTFVCGLPQAATADNATTTEKRGEQQQPKTIKEQIKNQSPSFDASKVFNVTFTPQEMSQWRKESSDNLKICGSNVVPAKPSSDDEESESSTISHDYSSGSGKASSPSSKSGSYGSGSGSGSSAQPNGGGSGDDDCDEEDTADQADEDDCDEDDASPDQEEEDCDENETTSSSAPEPSATNAQPKTTKAPSATSAAPKNDNSGGSSTSSSSTSNDNGGILSWLTGGHATYYTQNGVAGSCGTVNSDNAMIVALPPKWASSSCGKKVRICKGTNAKGTGNCVVATAADTCPSCPPPSIDLSVGTFKALESDLGVGQFDITWAFI